MGDLGGNLEVTILAEWFWFSDFECRKILKELTCWEKVERESFGRDVEI